MEAERESVGLAIPFVAGVVIANHALSTFCTQQGALDIVTCGCISAFSIVGALCILIRERVLNVHALRLENLSLWQGRALLWTLFILAGLSTGLINLIPTASLPYSDGFLKSSAASCAERLKAAIDAIPYNDNFCNAVLKAFLTGDRSALTSHTKDIFRLSGASHLLALSGMHLGIIYILLSKVVGTVGNSPLMRKTRSGLIIAGSGFFTIMTGASPSLVRAFLFITLNEIAKISGRRQDGLTTLTSALMIQLAFNPAIISSISFQLSYLAMTGIFTLYPWLQKFFPEDNETKFSKIMRKIWNLCALSISCQVFTAPLAWLRFGTFPKYFLLTNLLCIPLMSLIMFSGIAVIALHPLGLCPGLFISVSEFLLQSLLFILEIISSM